jgi:hypothetical protein
MLGSTSQFLVEADPQRDFKIKQPTALMSGYGTDALSGHIEASITGLMHRSKTASLFDPLCSNRCSPPPSANASSQNLVNATAIEIDDLETPPLMIKGFANGRQVTELIENEARSGVIFALRREGHGQPISHLVDRHAAGDEP